MLKLCHDGTGERAGAAGAPGPPGRAAGAGGARGGGGRSGGGRRAAGGRADRTGTPPPGGPGGPLTAGGGGGDASRGTSRDPGDAGLLSLGAAGKQFHFTFSLTLFSVILSCR